MDLEEKLLKLFKEKNLYLGLAESCTGGALAARIASVSGASAYFKGGIVAYSEEVKRKILGVREKTLLEFGAVSREAAREMAAGALNSLGSDIALAVTGIAGPSSDERNTPVGTAFIAIAGVSGILESLGLEIRSYHFKGKRGEIIEETVQEALKFLAEFLENQN